MSTVTLSVVIPTYQRGSLLLDTLHQLFAQTNQAKQIFVVDQTQYQEGDQSANALRELHNNGKITWMKLSRPSIPHAMNVGLLAASTEYVLFLDDDVRFGETFIQEHCRSLHEYSPVAQVGQIIQPWQQPVARRNYRSTPGLSADLNFPFNSNEPARIANCMAGNLVVQRSAAIAAGGFDENFGGAAYRFETEFCRRLISDSGRPFHFVPGATLDHLHHSSGGTRSLHHYQTSASPQHSAGDYYFAMRQGQGVHRLKYILKRLFGSLWARFYLSRPWYLPVRFIAELRGIVLAIQLKMRGPRLLTISATSADNGVAGTITGKDNGAST